MERTAAHCLGAKWSPVWDHCWIQHTTDGRGELHHTVAGGRRGHGSFIVLLALHTGQ